MRKPVQGLRTVANCAWYFLLGVEQSRSVTDLHGHSVIDMQTVGPSRQFGPILVGKGKRHGGDVGSCRDQPLPLIPRRFGQSVWFDLRSASS